MSVITAIEPQKRRGNRRSIFVDGHFVAGVDEEVVVVQRLAVGQQVDEDRLTQVLRTEDVRRARESALGLLEYRSRSEDEIRKRLLQKGYSEDIVDEAIQILARADLVNDERFSSEWVASRLNFKPMGKRRIAYELRQKGVEQGLVDEAVEQIDEEREFEMALDLARRKYKPVVSGADTRNERQRISGYLARRGFGWGIVSRVFAELFSEE